MSLADPTSVSHRSTRSRPAKPPLSEAAILDAALAILQSDGLDAVSMRRVANALDTGAASLYVYVSGRDALLEAMLDRVVQTIKLEKPNRSRWRSQLHAVLMRMRRALAAHPGIAATTLADPPPTEAVMLLVENLMGIMLAGGIEPQSAAWACDIFTQLVTATALEYDEQRARGRDSHDAEGVYQLEQTFAGLPASRFPLLTSLSAEMVAGSSDERFRFAIDVVIDGMLSKTKRR